MELCLACRVNWTSTKFCNIDCQRSYLTGPSCDTCGNMFVYFYCPFCPMVYCSLRCQAKQDHRLVCAQTRYQRMQKALKYFEQIHDTSEYLPPKLYGNISWIRSGNTKDYACLSCGDNHVSLIITVGTIDVSWRKSYKVAYCSNCFVYKNTCDPRSHLTRRETMYTLILCFRRFGLHRDLIKQYIWKYLKSIWG